MFPIKNQYYLFIENTTNIDFDFIKIKRKFTIIYRNNKNVENIQKLKKFKNRCKLKGIAFFIANDIKLLTKINADGLYISAHNKSLRVRRSLNKAFKIIGSAHNFKEIIQKKNQKCETIILSRLFETNYKDKKGFLGIVKFNIISNFYKNTLVPLGGIKSKNINRLKLVNSNAFCLLSEIKKKPAITSRLF